MKFYSRVINKPNSVIKEVKDGLKIVKQTRICVFQNGEFETEDPKIIEKLQAHPNLFRTDQPWPKPLGNKVKYELLKYKEIYKKAQDAGINPHKMKKEAIIEALIKKEGELKNDIS